MPVSFCWGQGADCDISAAGLAVTRHESRSSGQLDYTITAELDGEGTGYLVQDGCSLQYVWELTGESAVIRYEADVATSGAAVNTVIAHADTVDLLQANDIRYLAIDETPTFAGDEALPTFVAGWFKAAPYYYPVYRDLGVMVYRVDESVLQGPQQTVNTVMAGDDSESPELTLLGWRQLSPAQPGQLLTVAFYWRGERPIEKDCVVFVHLGDGNVVVAQNDSVPSDQGNPTTAWVPGETVIDLHTIELPADFTPGTYYLSTGMYDVATGERLLAYDDQGEHWSG